MFRKLQERWKVSGPDMVFILIAFAITGTLTAWISREITNWYMVPRYTLSWWMLKFIILIFGYQVILLSVGFLTGQFHFFWKFEQKFLRTLGLLKKADVNIPIRVAIFASGAGSNAREIIKYFKNNDHIKISL